MACFIVPLVQAVATTVYRKRHAAAIAAPDAPVLIVDHVINGELTWRFPFFTALDQAGGGLVMLREMLTVGVPMSLVLTAAWLVWALARDRKRAAF